MNTIKFFQRNWIRAFGDALARYYYPQYRRVDTKHIRVLETEYGSFYYSGALQEFPDLFEQIEEYNIQDLRETDVVIDVGANIGAFTVKVASKVKHVIAVEPLFFEELQNNVKLNNLDNVTCLPFALGTGDSFEINFCNRRRKIQTMQYSDILARCPFMPTFMKIDCEGGEWAEYPADLTKGLRALEGEIHNFSSAGRRENPERYVQGVAERGFKCKCSSTPDGQIMLHARTR